MHDTSIWMSLTSFGPISLRAAAACRGTGRTYWRMVQMSKHGDSWAGNGLSCTHMQTHTHTGLTTHTERESVCVCVCVCV